MSDTTVNTLRCIHCDRDVHYTVPADGTAPVLVTDAGYSYCYKVGYWASDAHEVAAITDEEWFEQIGAYEHDGIADIFAAHEKADRKAARIRKIITGLRIALLVITFAVGFAEANQARKADAS